MIEVGGLTKRFGRKTAVDDLSFTVAGGRVTGFLGPNGAGKSTTMRCILGLDWPAAGSARINGKFYRELADPLRTVGALLEAKSVHPGRSARNHLRFLAQTQGLPARRVDEMLALVGLHDVAHARAGGFSPGIGPPSIGPSGIGRHQEGGPLVATTSPVLPAATPATSGAARRVRFGGLLAAEWTKISSVRSTVWTLILFVVLTVGLTAGLTELIVANWNAPRAGAGDLRIVADPVAFILGTGIGLGQLTICVLGVLVITTEYSSGVIRASLLAVPRRLPMLVAKITVFAALLIMMAEVVAFGSFFVGSALLHSKAPVALGDHNVARAVIGAGLYLTVLGLFALAIGGLIRHTAGAIATVIGVVLVLPILSGLLPGDWGTHVDAYLPEQAGSLIYGARPRLGAVLSAWEGFGVFCLWTAVLLAVAAYLLNRRDA